MVTPRGSVTAVGATTSKGTLKIQAALDERPHAQGSTDTVRDLTTSYTGYERLDLRLVETSFLTGWQFTESFPLYSSKMGYKIYIS
ncbi:MAG: hypothetical protein ACREWE_02895 [Gammaproteobacteria bacterium]